VVPRRAETEIPMLGAATVVSLALSLFAGVPVAADPPPQGPITIENVTVNGSGCLPHAVATAISPDKQAFTVIYSQYIASLGPGTKPADAHNSCKLMLKLDVPAGINYTFAELNHRGYARLEPGVTAKQTTTYSFGGNDKVVTTHSQSGPWDDDWQFTGQAASLPFAPCGKDRKLHIDTDVALTAGSEPQTAVSRFDFDSTDVQTNHDMISTYKLIWKKC
jgi:hypothetical protein